MNKKTDAESIIGLRNKTDVNLITNAINGNGKSIVLLSQLRLIFLILSCYRIIFDGELLQSKIILNRILWILLFYMFDVDNIFISVY